MAKVFFHCKHTGSSEPTNLELSFLEIPRVGEYVVLHLEPGKQVETWFEVYLVAHCCFEDTDYDVEIYAVERDYISEIQSKINAA